MYMCVCFISLDLSMQAMEQGSDCLGCVEAGGLKVHMSVKVSGSFTHLIKWLYCKWLIWKRMLRRTPLSKSLVRALLWLYPHWKLLFQKLTALSKIDCLLCCAVLLLTNDCGKHTGKDLQFSNTFQIRNAFREESTVYPFLCFFVCYSECWFAWRVYSLWMKWEILDGHVNDTS